MGGCDDGILEAFLSTVFGPTQIPARGRGGAAGLVILGYRRCLADTRGPRRRGSVLRHRARATPSFSGLLLALAYTGGAGLRLGRGSAVTATGRGRPRSSPGITPEERAQGSIKYYTECAVFQPSRRRLLVRLAEPESSVNELVHHDTHQKRPLHVHGEQWEGDNKQPRAISCGLLRDERFAPEPTILSEFSTHAFEQGVIYGPSCDGSVGSRLRCSVCYRLLAASP